MTATELLAALRSADCEPTVEGKTITFEHPVPPLLEPYVVVLQTGLRALLTGAKWYGIDRHGRGAARPGGELNPALPLPRSVRLLTVAGDPAWDRVLWHWPRDFGALFAPPKVKAANKGAA